MSTNPRLSLSRLLSGLLLAVLLILTAVSVAPAYGLAPAAGQAPASGEASLNPVAAPATGSGPLFIENVGQFGPGARFRSSADGATLWLADDALWLVAEPGPPAGPWRSDELARQLAARTDSTVAPSRAARGSAVRLRFVGANPTAPEPFGRRSTRLSYYLGADAANWFTNVPAWSGVRYAGLYPGVDLILGGETGHRATLICRAADCAAALAAVELAVDGATALALDGDALRLETAAGPLRWTLPFAVDPTGAPLDHDLRPRLNGDTLLAPVAASANPPATAAPVAAAATTFTGNTAELLFGTFLGGASYDYLEAVAVDGAGRATVFGDTLSADFPTTPGAFDRGFNGGGFPGGDVVVARFNAAGTELEYATFIGGAASDLGLAGAVDSSGNTFVTGWTESADFPTTGGAYDRTANGDADAFVVKLNSFGGLAYGTYLGGSAAHEDPEDDYLEWQPSGFDGGFGLALDSRGAALIIGTTRAADFPTTADAFDRVNEDVCYDRDFLYPCADAFIARLSPSGGALEFASFLGGSDEEFGREIVLDSAGRPVLAGDTFSVDFPVTANAFDPDGGGFDRDAFIARLSANAAAIQYATFIGGVSAGDAFYEGDQAGALAVDGPGNIFLTGQTWSADFPSTNGAFDTSRNGGLCDAGPFGDPAPCPDVFVLRLRADGQALAFSTYVGGGEGGPLGGNEMGTGLGLDALGDVLVTGTTGAPDFPTTPGAYSTIHNGAIDTFLLRLSPNGAALQYSTFLNIRPADSAPSLAAGPEDVFVTGQTLSTLPMTAGAYDVDFNGEADGFLLRLAIGPTPANAGWQPIGANSATGGGISQTAGESARPELAQMGDGALVVAWSDSSSGNAEIYVRRWDGQAWGEMGAGSASGGGVSNNRGRSVTPALVAGPDGRAYLAWSDDSSGNTEIYVRRWDGGAWVEIGGSASGGGISNSKGESESPAVALDGDAPIVVWEDTSGGDSEIYARRWDGQAWAEMGKGSATGGGISRNQKDSYQPAVAVAAGVPFVAWADGIGGETEIFVRRFNGSKWVLAGKNSASGGGISDSSGVSRGVRLAAAGKEVYAAWSNAGDGDLEIYVRRFDGKAWGEVGRGSARGGGISANTADSQAVSLSVTAAGAPIAAWHDSPDRRTTEVYARVWNGARWEEVTTGTGRGGGISDNDGHSNWPALLVAADGVPTVAWNDDSSGNHEIYVRRATAAVCYRLRLSHSGQGDDPVALPASSFGCQSGWYTAGTPIALTAAPLAGWRVAGWQGTDSDGSQTLGNTLTMPAANHTATVIYVEEDAACYPLTLSHLGEGADPSASPGKAPNCPSGQYQAGTVISLLAAPAAGWRVNEWVGTNDDSSKLSTNVLTMPPNNHTVTVIYGQESAVCHPLDQVFTGFGNFPVLTPPASAGCAEGRFVAGELVTLTARPAAGWQVRDWQGTDHDAGAAGQKQLVMPDDGRRVTVRYTPLPGTPGRLFVPVARR